MKNPQDTLWLDRLGIGTGGKPYVQPIEPPTFEDDPHHVKMQWDAEDAYFETNGIDPVAVQESIDLVTNA